MTAKNHFADRLNQKIKQTKSPLVVGLDPRFNQLPPALTGGVSSIETTAEDKAQITTEFCKGVIDVVAPLVPAVKPQAAFFEQLGPLGMMALAEVVDHATAAGLIVICLLYTSPSPRDATLSRMPSSA